MSTSKGTGSEFLEMIFSIPVREFQMSFVICVDDCC